MPQEDIFAVIESVVANEKSIYRIPDGLWRKKEKEIKERRDIKEKNEKLSGSIIRGFTYNIELMYFCQPVIREVNSLFFEGKLKETAPAFVTDNFFVLKFDKDSHDKSMLERDTMVEKILRGGIKVGNDCFHVVGCSNSQIQGKCFCFMKGGRDTCDQAIKDFIPSIEQLETKKGVAKRTKYVGLLFTDCQYLVKLPKSFEWEKGDDYEKGKYNFTDGCGIISYKLAKEILEKNLELKKKWKEEIPSVWQIRYCGHGYLCKGVVVLDHSEKNRSIMTFRKSMLKVKVDARSKVCKSLENSLGIVATSITPKIGKLNKQVIALLSATVPKKIAIDIQAEYLDSVSKARVDPVDALKCLAMKRNLPEIKGILRKWSFEKFPPKYFTSLLRSIEPQRKSTSLCDEKIQIPLASSRLLFGVAMPEFFHSRISEGQCVVFTEFGYREGPVIVYRSPSYSPGDVQVLKAVNPESLGLTSLAVLNLRNVIIFSTSGERPDPDKMSGGDLDGDLYLVIWDHRLLKFKDKIKAEEIKDYQVDSTTHQKKHLERNEDWLRYIARWENTILAQIDSCFFQIASEKGINSRECSELCDIFSGAVDQNPSDLEKLKQIASDCCGRKEIEQIIATSSHKLPVWEQILRNQKNTFEDLRRREDIPNFKEFYDKLIFFEKSQVSDILDQAVFVDCLHDKDRMEVKKLWKRLCKGERCVDPHIPMLSPRDCDMFDCVKKECSASHRKDAIFYKTKWDQRMRAEMTRLIKPMMDALEETKTEIQKWKALWEIDREESARWQEDFKKVVKRRFNLNNLQNTAAEIINEERNLERLQDGMKERNIVERVVVHFNLPRFADRILKRERDALNQVKFQEEKLKDLYNKSLKIERTVRENFDKPGDHLTAMRETNALESSREVRKVRRSELDNFIKECYQDSMVQDPELRPSNTENLEKLKWKTLTREREKNEVLKSLEEKKDDVMKKMKETDDQIMKVVENLSEIFMLQHVSRSCHKLIDMKKSNQRDSEYEEHVDILMQNSELFHSQTDDYSHRGEENDLFPESYLREIIRKVEEKHSMLEKKTEEKKEHLRKLQDRKAKAAIDLNQIKDRQTAIKNEQEILSEKLLSYEQMKDKVYDDIKMNEAKEKYEEITEKTKCFELALSALLNEVEDRFGFKNENLLDDDRIRSTIELKMCLQREKKRCERELTDNKLPIFSVRNSILEALIEDDVVIIVAGTGSGKSTQVPQYLADDLHQALSQSRFPKIACTQPRRVAAVRIAERVALEYAGAIDVPSNKSKDDGSDADSPSKQNDVAVNHFPNFAAYPLYASLPQDDQDRALDEQDRVGHHMPYSKTVQQKAKPDKDIGSSLKGTAGEVGQWVGFQVGSKNKSPEEKKNCKKLNQDTRIQFVTEGLLLQKLKNHSDLSQYQCIVVDEAHERGKDTDLLMAHLQSILKKSKKDSKNASELKVAVMSASINQQAFSDYFGGCPIIECKGKMFEVKETYIPVPDVDESDERVIYNDEVPSDDYSDISSVDSESDTESDVSRHQEKKKSVPAVIKLVSHAVNVIFNKLTQPYPGDVLVFLPGRREIELCVEMINKRATKATVFTRKVVCCTNIAETSLTIPGVRFVLDGGKAKKMTFDHKLRVSALKLENSSQASAKQRKGRAGRVQSGVCYRLYSEEHFRNEMREFDEPEMKQCAIDELYMYALDLFDRLENIVLMEDARPEKEAIQLAKERLFNFGYIDEKDLKLTEEGKFALMLMADLSLERSKLILAGIEHGIVEEALTLAVATQEDIFRNESDFDNDERKKYIDETGDHLTVMNIYKNFEEREKESSRRRKRTNVETPKEWCEKIGVSYDVLRQISKSIDSVYKILKRNKYYGKIFPDKQGDSHIDAMKHKPHNDILTSKVDDKVKLLKCMIAGYFHNIVEAHDTRYIKSGYSVVTPTNYGSMQTDGEDAELLKVDLAKESLLFTHGDKVVSKFCIYSTLFLIENKMKDTKLVLMKMATRINPDWISEYSSQRWRSTVFCKSYLKHGQINAGPAVLGAVIKENGDYIRKIEIETNAKIRFLFDDARVKIYGSSKEVKGAGSKLSQFVCDKKKDFKKNDKEMKYPLQESQSCICTIKYGFQVSTIKDSLISPIIEDWELLQSGVLIFINPGSKEKIENALKVLKKIEEDPDIFCRDGKFGKVTFSSQKTANEVHNSLSSKIKLHQYGFSDNTSCFPDQNQELKVLKTSIYPSVMNIAKEFSYIEVEDKFKMFKLKIRTPKGMSRCRKGFEEFIERLREEKVFGCCMIETLKTSDFGERDFIYKQLKSYIKEEEGLSNIVKVLTKKYPTPRIEIYGECERRERVADDLRCKIGKIRKEIETGNYRKTFNRNIPIGTLQLYNKILLNLKKLKGKHNNVVIKICGGAEGNCNSEASKREVQIRANDRKYGLLAEKDVLAILQGSSTEAVNSDGVDEERTKCTRCSHVVHLPLSSKQKEEKRRELRRTRRELKDSGTNANGFMIEGQTKKKRIHTENDEKLDEACRLTLCGCIYCKDCVYHVLFNELEKQAASKDHKPVSCVKCQEVVLMRDLYPLSFKCKESLGKQALMNYLVQSCKEERRGMVPEECSVCNTLMIREANKLGVYRCINNKCRVAFCNICGECIMNKLNFEDHQTMHSAADTRRHMCREKQLRRAHVPQQRSLMPDNFY